MIFTDLFESRDICRVCGQTPCNCTHIAESVGGNQMYEIYDLATRQGVSKPFRASSYETAHIKADDYLESIGRSGEGLGVRIVKQGVEEGVGNVGAGIKSLFQKIYDQGDDEIEYFYYESPVFAQYWDQYEGDIDSIIAEVDPAELQIIHDELEAYAEGAGLAEEKVRLDPRCWKGKKIGNPKTKMKGGVRVNNCVPAESIDEASLATMRHYFGGDENAVDPSKLAAMRDYFTKLKADGKIDTKQFNSVASYLYWLEKNKQRKDAQTESHDNGEYSDEAGMARGNLITIAKAAEGLLHTIDQHEDLPEWVQEKIAKVEGMLVTAWNYLQSQEAQGIDPRVEEMYANLAENWQRVSHRLELNQEFDLIESIIESIADRNGVDAEAVWADLESLTEDELYVFAVTSEPIMEDWQKVNKKDKTDGMSRKAVNAYRREHPGSKLKTAVTTKPSKLKKGSKASKRRKSYCSRSRGQMKMHSISCSKTPDKAICKARRRWNCEGVDRSDQAMVAEESDKQFAQRMKKQAEQPPTKGMSQKEKVAKGWAHPDTLKKKGVAEGVASHAELAQKAYDAYIQATRQGNGVMAAHYSQEHERHKKLAAVEKKRAAKGHKGVAEVSDATLTSYLTKVDADSQKHEKDPTKRSPAKRNRSVAGFARAFNKLDARKEKTDENLGDEFMKMAQSKGYNVRRAGTPDQERERTQQMLAQRAKDREAETQRIGQEDFEIIDQLRQEYADMKAKYQSLGGSNWQYADREQNLTDRERQARAMEPALRSMAQRIANAEKSQGLTEISKQKLGDYLHAAHRDVVDRATSSSFKSGQAGDRYNKADVSDKERQREQGMARAVKKLTMAEAWASRYPNLHADLAEAQSAGDDARVKRLSAIKEIIDSDLQSH